MINYDLKVGFSRIEINPPLGVNVTGYFLKRYADGILDDTEINTVAIGKGGKTVILITLDCMEVTTDFCTSAREAVAKATGVDKDAVFIHALHPHTGMTFAMEAEMEFESEKEYISLVRRKIADSAVYAIKDMNPARMGVAVGKAERIGFNRRYLMKDGSVQTNPGVNNPDIVKSIGLLDERVNVIRFERECGDNVVLGNYGNHPDVIGGCSISADWPGFTRRIFERAVDDAKCVFFNGAQGDINHVNVAPKGGDLNGMFNDFDDVTRGYAHSRHMGNVVAAAIMSVYEKVEFIPADSLDFVQKDIMIASNMPKPEDMEQARYIDKLHNEGRDAELPYKGMMLTTVVAEAGRMLRLEHGPEYFPLHLSAIKIGDVAFIGIPGEPFTGIGLGLKDAEDWKMVCPTCITNGYSGYFPMKDSYDEGGYEARSSIYKAGVAETIIEEGKKILNGLRK
ncbi:MAG: hypothetical protein IJX91_02165 [Clostridia bacterium]|nr:hypothetical protein [Clostridia bacterium]